MTTKTDLALEALRMIEAYGLASAYIVTMPRVPSMTWEAEVRFVTAEGRSMVASGTGLTENQAIGRAESIVAQMAT